MAYDEALASRVRDRLINEPQYTELKMFGGLCFMIRGNMACGIVGDKLMVRVEKGRYEEMLALPHAEAMDFTGKPMKGFLYVQPEGLVKDADVDTWVERGAAYARKLPAKAKKS